MRTLKEKLGLAWLTPQYFLTGWSYFFKQEFGIIFVWMLIGISASVLLGCWQYVSLWKMAVFFVFFRRFLAGGICTSSKRLDGKVVLVTGANVGIGKETAKDMLLRGAEVVIACRDLQKGQYAARDLRLYRSGTVTAMELDLASFSSVKRFAKEFASKYNKLDILINNAGVMMCPEMQTEDGFELQMGTNHLGHFLLTSLLMPQLRASPKARIVNLSSFAHWMSNLDLDNINLTNKYDRTSAYGNSKLANILFSREFNERFSDTNISAFSLHPGFVQSELGRHLPWILAVLLSNWIKLIYKTTAEGAQTSIYCALEDKPGPYSYFADCAPANLSNEARDPQLPAKFWDLSEKLCKISFK